MGMSFWPPLALAVVLGVSSASLAAEPRPGGPPPAVAPAAVGVPHPLRLDLPLRLLSQEDAAAMPAPAATGTEALASPDGEPSKHHFDLHLGRAPQAGRSPGDAPPLYGEVGVDLDPRAGLSIVPSYRVVLDQSDRADARTIDAQVLKLGARIRF
jgi:hypothetical protein